MVLSGGFSWTDLAMLSRHLPTFILKLFMSVYRDSYWRRNPTIIFKYGRNPTAGRVEYRE